MRTMSLPLSVMAGLDPAIHAVPHAPKPFGRKDVDARIKSGHDDLARTFRSDR